MNLQNVPENYRAAFNELVYTIVDVEENQKIEVAVFDSEQVNIVGIKQFVGQNQYSVNVSSYLQRQFDIAPLESSECSLVAAVGRLKNVSISIDGQQASSQSCHTFGVLDARPKQILSRSPRIRQISDGQRDEISFVAPSSHITVEMKLTGQEKTFGFGLNNVLADHNVQSLMIDMDHIVRLLTAAQHSLDDFSQMTVTISADGVPLIVQRYKIEPLRRASVRMCWINQYGMIDYYTALRTAVRSTDTRRSAIYSEHGYKSMGAVTETTSTIISQYEPRSTMEWLSEIIGSPRVWVVENGVYVPVNVRSQSTVLSADGLTRMELSVSPLRKTFTQKN